MRAFETFWAGADVPHSDVYGANVTGVPSVSITNLSTQIYR